MVCFLHRCVHRYFTTRMSCWHRTIDVCLGGYDHRGAIRLSKDESCFENTIVMIRLSDKMIQKAGHESLLSSYFLSKYICVLQFHIAGRDL